MFGNLKGAGETTGAYRKRASVLEKVLMLSMPYGTYLKNKGPHTNDEKLPQLQEFGCSPPHDVSLLRLKPNNYKRSSQKANVRKCSVSRGPTPGWTVGYNPGNSVSQPATVTASPVKG